MSIGKTIRDFRKQRGLTLLDLSKTLGVSCSFLSALEREVKKPSIPMVKKLAEVLNISPTYLFGAEKIYGQKIRYIREGRSLSLEELGELSGIPADIIRNYEEGKQEPNLDTLEHLADALSVTVRYFLERSSDTLSIGDRIKQEREKKNLTGTSLAEKAGITPSTISQIENNQTEPSLDTLEGISKALDVSICYFLLEKEDVENLIASLNSDVITLLGDPRIQSVLRAVRDMDSGDLKFILNYIQFFKRNRSLLDKK